MSLAEYDAFEHLRRALFWEPDRPILMLTFYADDAGKKDDHDYIVVAGYIGLVAQWERFCTDWRLALARSGLPEFHASDFFTGSGIFAGWENKKRAGERKQLLTTLAQIVNDYALQSFSCIIDISGWLKANEDYLLDEAGFSPYPLGGRTVVQRVREWCPQFGHDPTRVEYIFDQGSDDWGKLKTVLKVDFGVDALERDRRKVRPLQAADWIAYEEFREVPQSEAVRFNRKRTREFRESYRALLQLPNDPIIFRASDFITQICAVPEMKIPERSAQGKAAVRFKYDDRKMTRISWRYKRLKQELSTLLDVKLAAADKSRIDKLQHDAEHAAAMAQIHGNRVIGYSNAMRADNPENQASLLTGHVDEWHQLREWQEKHCDLMEQIIHLLKSRKAKTTSSD